VQKQWAFGKSRSIRKNGGTETELSGLTVHQTTALARRDQRSCGAVVAQLWLLPWTISMEWQDAAGRNALSSSVFVCPAVISAKVFVINVGTEF